MFLQAILTCKTQNQNNSENRIQNTLNNIPVNQCSTRSNINREYGQKHDYKDSSHFIFQKRTMTLRLKNNFSIWKDTYQYHSTSNSDTSNSEVSTLGMSIGISNKSNNTIIEISLDPTKYKTLDVEDTKNDTLIPLTTTIDTDDQTTISTMTSNNYDYKKADKVDKFIMKFLQNNNNLPTFSQQKFSTTKKEDQSREDPINNIPYLHFRQDYDSEVDDDDAFSTSRKLQKAVYEKTNSVEIGMKGDEQHNILQHSDKENITSNSDSSFSSNHSSTFISNNLKNNEPLISETFFKN